MVRMAWTLHQLAWRRQGMWRWEEAVEKRGSTMETDRLNGRAGTQHGVLSRRAAIVRLVAVSAGAAVSAILSACGSSGGTSTDTPAAKPATTVTGAGNPTPAATVA